MDAATADAGLLRSVRIVPAVLGAVGVVFLVVALACATRSVPVHQIGDSAPYRCSPIGSAFADAPTGPDCAPHVRVRLAEAAVAGIAGGVFSLVALVVALGISRDARESAVG